MIQITLHVWAGLPALLPEELEGAEVVFMNGLEGGSGEHVGGGVVGPGLPVGEDGVDLGRKGLQSQCMEGGGTRRGTHPRTDQCNCFQRHRIERDGITNTFRVFTREKELREDGDDKTAAVSAEGTCLLSKLQC